MTEIIFLVEKAPEGGYTAQALGHAIFTDASDWKELQERARDAVRCHFDNGEAERVVGLTLSA